PAYTYDSLFSEARPHGGRALSSLARIRRRCASPGCAYEPESDAHRSPYGSRFGRWCSRRSSDRTPSVRRQGSPLGARSTAASGQRESVSSADNRAASPPYPLLHCVCYCFWVGSLSCEPPEDGRCAVCHRWLTNHRGRIHRTRHLSQSAVSTAVSTQK